MRTLCQRLQTLDLLDYFQKIRLTSALQLLAHCKRHDLLCYLLLFIMKFIVLWLMSPPHVKNSMLAIFEPISDYIFISKIELSIFVFIRGYMAPEYVVRGKLTEKADVYSFGVLILEVVCGKRNSSFSENSSILQMVNVFTWPTSQCTF